MMMESLLVFIDAEGWKAVLLHFQRPLEWWPLKKEAWGVDGKYLNRISHVARLLLKKLALEQQHKLGKG